LTARVDPADRRLDGATKTNAISDAMGRGYAALFTELVVSDAGQNLPRAIVEPHDAPLMDVLEA
jgi:hypothetical protein